MSEWYMDSSSTNYYSESNSSQLSITMPRGDIRPVYFTVYENNGDDEEKTMYDGNFDEI